MKVNRIKQKPKQKCTKEEFEKIQQEIYNNSSNIWRDNMLNDFGKVKL
jgi:hypothetical protein